MPSQDLTKINSRFGQLIIDRKTILKLANMAVFEYFTVHRTPVISSFDPKVDFGRVARLPCSLRWGDVLAEKVVHLVVAVDTAGGAALLGLRAYHNFVWDHIQ